MDEKELLRREKELELKEKLMNQLLFTKKSRTVVLRISDETYRIFQYCKNAKGKKHIPCLGTMLTLSVITHAMQRLTEKEVDEILNKMTVEEESIVETPEKDNQLTDELMQVMDDDE